MGSGVGSGVGSGIGVGKVYSGKSTGRSRMQPETAPMHSRSASSRNPTLRFDLLVILLLILPDQLLFQII